MANPAPINALARRPAHEYGTSCRVGEPQYTKTGSTRTGYLPTVVRQIPQGLSTETRVQLMYGVRGVMQLPEA